MEFWADKYVGKVWFTDVKEYQGDKMCILLVLHVLNQEIQFEILSSDKKRLQLTSAEWYNEAPKSFIEGASTYGETIHHARDLREFDVPFFKIDGAVQHCGVMIDNYGRFLHQQKTNTAHISRINSPLWDKRFFAGIKKLPDDPKAKIYAPAGEYFISLVAAFSHANEK